MIADGMTVQAEMTANRPDYKPLARVLLEEARAFFQNPEMEAEYQAWLAKKNSGVKST